MHLATNSNASIDHHTFAREMENSVIRHVDMDRACDEVFHMRVYVEREDGTKRTYYIAGRGDAKGGFLDINARDDGWANRYGSEMVL